MTLVFYTPLKNACLPKASVLNKLPPLRLDRIRSVLRRGKALELCYVWLLLDYALRQLGKDASILQLLTKTLSGKPVFASKSLWCSLSHCRSYVACAVSEDGAVGLDVQEIRLIPRSFYLPYFSENDRALLPTDAAGLCQCWCEKEALVKLHGDGWTAESKAKDSLGSACKILWPDKQTCLAVCGAVPTRWQEISTNTLGGLYE